MPNEQRTMQQAVNQRTVGELALDPFGWYLTRGISDPKRWFRVSVAAAWQCWTCSLHILGVF